MRLKLQIAILREQKIAKLIGMTDKLRRASPTLDSGHDAEAAQMAQSADPIETMELIEARGAADS